MKIKLTSVYVDDQEKALRFYTDVLGFTKKTDFSNGPYRWLTVASPEEPDGTELQLALNDNPAAKAYQQAMFQQGQPAAMFYTDDVKGDYERIKARGAEFTMPPTEVIRLDHRPAERHLRQPHSNHPAGALVAQAFGRHGCAGRSTRLGSSSEEVPLNWNMWVRQIHRWLSIIFTAIVVAIFIALGVGKEPAQWVYFLPLLPLALLMLTGLYMFVLPYAAKWRSGRAPRTGATQWPRRRRASARRRKSRRKKARRAKRHRSRSPARSSCSRAATRRSPRATATPPCRPTSRPCRAGKATSGAASTRSSCAPSPACARR